MVHCYIIIDSTINDMLKAQTALETIIAKTCFKFSLISFVLTFLLETTSSDIPVESNQSECLILMLLTWLCKQEPS